MSSSNLTWFTPFKNPTLAVYHAKLLATGWNPTWVADHDNSNMSWVAASLSVPQANCWKWTCNKQGISSFSQKNSLLCPRSSWHHYLINNGIIKECGKGHKCLSRCWKTLKPEDWSLCVTEGVLSEFKVLLTVLLIYLSCQYK